MTLHNGETRPAEPADVAEVVKEWKGKSQSELLDALKTATDTERAAGNLDNTRMDEIYEKLSPMLSDRQREKMLEVLARLKE